MNYFLSLETAKQLKEWGCDGVFTEAHDIRDIICDGEMAKKFFFNKDHYQEFSVYNEEQIKANVQEMVSLLHKNKKEEAEAYLLENTIFNPRNK
jgi:hypothetical protein